MDLADQKRYEEAQTALQQALSIMDEILRFGGRYEKMAAEINKAKLTARIEEVKANLQKSDSYQW